VVAEKYAAEIEAVRRELPDLEHVLARDSEYESWPARQSAVDPDPDLMRRERTACMFMVPTILNAINRIPDIESAYFPGLKCMLVLAAPISDETALKAYKIFGDAMYQGCGLTEVLPVAMMGPSQWLAKDVPGSQPLHACGMPLPFAELQISDESNRLPSASSIAG
jgi:acyl-coenzyme A synthetase/AMP-(fatty) acid ligase